MKHVAHLSIQWKAQNAGDINNYEIKITHFIKK